MGSGGAGVTIGSLEQSLDQKTAGTSAAASTVGSIAGNVTLVANEAYKQVGSDVQAPGGDITIVAKKVDIVEARETSQSETEQKFKQGGLTFEVTSPIISAIQTMEQMSQAADNTSDGRMKGLAAANAAFAAKNAYNAVQAGQLPKPTGGNNPSANTDVEPSAGEQAGGINLAISIGSSESQSNSASQSNTARGSTVTAAGNVLIAATGAGQDSNLTIQGSTVEAGKAAQLLADNEIKLLAAQNAADQKSTNSSSSGSIGVSFGTDGFLVNASASGSKGKANGSDTSYTNTEIKAGTQATLTSGGDTTLQGAVVKAETIKADIGGNLIVESLQDTSTYTSQQKSIGGSISVGLGKMSGSFNASKSNIDSDFKSVGEQSGIKAGDGGFQVNVGGNTTLNGSVIASNQAAVEQGKNSFQTGGTLNISDIQNSASYDAKSVSISVGTSQQPTGKLGMNGLGIGFGSDKGNASSTSSAGISGIAGNTAVRSTDAETGLKPIFDAAKVQAEVNAQMQITQAFTREAPKAVASFAASKYNELKDTDPTEAAKWAEGGIYRIALHTVVGALGGGLDGAAGAAVSASSANLMDALQDGIQQGLVDAGLSASAAKALAQTVATLTAAGVGAAVGGAQGAATAATVDANNRQLHPDERKLAAQLAAKSKGKYTVQQIEDAMRNSGNANGETIVTGMLVNVNDPRAIYDKGAQWQKGEDGNLVQVLPNGGKVDPALAAFITANTGSGNSAYSWYDEQLGKTSPVQRSSNISGNTKQRYEQYFANGKVYTLPVADCPAVSCTNDTPIARFGVSADDAATIAAYDAAKKKEMSKDAVTGGLIVATTVALPATVVGAAIGGAVVGGGSSAASQAIDGKDINGKEVTVDAAKGAAFGVVGYGVVKSFGVADDFLKGASTKADDAAAAAAANEARIASNAGTESPGFGAAAQREFQPGTTHRAENINAGQVTDRDGLPRIDDANTLNNNQIKEVLGQYPERWVTQRPAWKEGTLVVDRVSTQPETYQMVVSESQYKAMERALANGDNAAAAKNLGGWATKDSINTAADVRNNLAISSEWKGQGGEPMYSVEFTVQPGVGLREGTVGPMFDAKIQTELVGGGHQVQFMNKSPYTDPNLYKIDLSKSKELK